MSDIHIYNYTSSIPASIRTYHDYIFAILTDNRFSSMIFMTIRACTDKVAFKKEWKQQQIKTGKKINVNKLLTMKSILFSFSSPFSIKISHKYYILNNLRNSINNCVPFCTSNMKWNTLVFIKQKNIYMMKSLVNIKVFNASTDNGGCFHLLRYV